MIKWIKCDLYSNLKEGDENRNIIPHIEIMILQGETFCKRNPSKFESMVVLCIFSLLPIK